METITQTKRLTLEEPSDGVAMHWIGGQWLDSGEHRESINPATGEVIGRYVNGGRKEVELAVNAASQAFRETDWKHNRSLRARALNAMAARFESRAYDLTQLLSIEVGKILPHARFETSTVPFNLRFHAALVLTDYGRAAELDEDSLSIVIRQPVGVAGIFAPWNAPIALGIRSLARALAAGCTAAVILPKESAQLNALISEVISETDGLPPGVVNIVTSGREGLEHLVESPDVPVISFTGSTRTGHAISAAGAARLKRFGLELGGKTPMVIFDDAELDAVAAKVTAGLTVFAGQFCMTGSRAIVQRGIADRFRTVLTERLKKVRVGPASDPRSEMGPLINKPNVERVSKMVEDAIATGAKVIVRGGPATEGLLARGAFYRPTLLEVTDSRQPIVQQEVFGPVMTMQVFDTEAEAVSLANDSEYGLAASVWSRDVDRPLRVARALEAGTVWINDWASIHDEFEEGGFKQSGRGRLRGQSGLDDFLECKHIALQARDYQVLKSPGAVPNHKPTRKNMKTRNQIELTPGVTSRRGLALAVCAAVCVVGIALAQHAGKGHVKVTQLSQREIIEKLDGKDASVTVSEVTFEPGQEDLAHRHAGPVFGYVLEGEYEHAINDELVKTYKAGETFYEPSGCVHRVARNPSEKFRTRLLAVILHSRDSKEVTIPHKGKEKE